ncbi:hypothetical protein [Streptomyces sp. BK340]|uniref:hypothetical protein n=1 Tax=Streptomyces sp. BK340 TaxID=2572903 RepID=UPI00119F86D4|nr:hypothetical protein [Streptomyces sp. BK340]
MPAPHPVEECGEVGRSSGFAEPVDELHATSQEFAALWKACDVTVFRFLGGHSKRLLASLVGANPS